MNLITLLIGALVTARITRLVTTDRITEGPRNAVIRRIDTSSMWAYLIVCDWCISMYTGGAVAISGAYAGWWPGTWVIPLAFAFSYTAGWLASKEGD